MSVLANDRFLFRGKVVGKDNKNKGEWVEGNYLCDVDRMPPSSLSEFAHRIKPLYSQAFAQPVDPITIGQYTGILDKNKNKIWEHDVVMELLYGKYKLYYKVTYNEEEGSYMLATKDGPLYGIGTINSHKFEVVGNIFDNPEFGFSLENQEVLEETSERREEEMEHPSEYNYA